MIATGHPGPEAGAGAQVMFLHGSAGSSALWRQQIAAFSQTYRVTAPDLIGYGKAEPWTAGTKFSIDHEVRRLGATVPLGAEPLHVVGYSYGGAVALSYALAFRERVASLALIEPVAFYVLRYQSQHEAYGEVASLRREFLAILGHGGTEDALRLFLDYWTGRGSWDALSIPVRVEMMAKARKIRLDWDASFEADPGQDALSRLTMPTLLIHGSKSPRSTQQICRGLATLLPNASLMQFEGAGHMLPLTHGVELTRVLAPHFHTAQGSPGAPVKPNLCCTAGRGRVECGESA
jgi:pimeloyl-ACP methyl ester carboxylesterase